MVVATACNMNLAIKLKNVSVCYGKKFRHNQNYTMDFWTLNDGINENTTVEDLKKIIAEKYAHKVYLNPASKIIMLKNV